MKNEIYKRIADELKISENKVKFIDDHIFTELQRHMKDPAKLEFMINRFGVFEPKLQSIKKYTEAVMSNGGPQTTVMKNRIELYQKIIGMGEELMKIKKENGKKRNNFSEGEAKKTDDNE